MLLASASLALAQQKTAACWYDANGKSRGMDSCLIGSELRPCANPNAICTEDTRGVCRGSGDYSNYAVLKVAEGYQCASTFPQAEPERSGQDRRTSQSRPEEREDSGDIEHREAGLAQVPGRYQRNPVENDWHVGTISVEGSGFRWTNQADVSWSLTPNFENDTLVTGRDNPYFENGSKIFDLIVEDDRLLGFRFNNEDYLKQKRALPDAGRKVRAPRPLRTPAADIGEQDGSCGQRRLEIIDRCLQLTGFGASSAAEIRGGALGARIWVVGAPRSAHRQAS
jgi:hypothetical protein